MNTEKLRDEYGVEELPPANPKTPIILGLIILFTIFVALAGWASWAPLATTISTVGEVSADVNKKVVQSLEGGVIKAIYVDNGDHVKKGQLLIKLEDKDIKSQLETSNDKYQELLAKFARLQAQRRDEETIEFPDELKDEAKKEEQIRVFNLMRKNLSSKIEIKQNKIRQLKEQMVGINHIINSLMKQLNILREDFAVKNRLFKEKLINIDKINDLRLKIQNIKGEINQKESQVLSYKQEIDSIKKEIGLDKKIFKQEVLKDYINTKSQLSEVKAKLSFYKNKLERTDIKSPISGIVFGLQTHTVGAVIEPRKTILEIIPENSKLILDVKIEPQYITKVKVGQPATVIFPSFDNKKIDKLDGNVTYVSADSFKDPRQNISYYKAKIELTKDSMDIIKKFGYTLVPGMPVSAMINTGKKTLLDYLIKPLQELLLKSFNEE